MNSDRSLRQCCSETHASASFRPRSDKAVEMSNRRDYDHSGSETMLQPLTIQLTDNLSRDFTATGNYRGLTMN